MQQYSNQSILRMNHTDFKSYVEQAGLDAKLHQSEGVTWMLDRETTPRKGVLGGINADEMGLGKTIMMIGTMLSNLCDHTLIVLPLALLQQWKKEIKRTTGYDALIYHGRTKAVTPLAIIKKAQIVLTTYGEIQISKNELSMKPPSAVHSVQWDRIIFDEAHHIRNMRTSQFNGASQLKSRIRWMITGTPIQNDLQDFYSLCHVLGFEDVYYTSNTGREEIMDTNMLRRTKAEIGISMPMLKEESITVEWKNDGERMLADDIHSLIPNENGATADEPLGFADGLSADMGGAIMGLIMLAMIRCRQACTYPKMLKRKVEQYCDEGFMDEDDEDVLESVNGSSKLDAVFDKINERSRNGNKKLVFCHFRMEMDELKRRLVEKGIKTDILDGRVSPKNRTAVLENGDLDVLILQINTCCEGLNLQSFNEIYFVSPHWNPAVEDQAVARAHRIGQKKEVHVFRFYMGGVNSDHEKALAIDTYCLNVQGRKRELYL